MDEEGKQEEIDLIKILEELIEEVFEEKEENEEEE